MSRIGKIPVIIPEGIQVTPEKHTVSVVGPKGQLKINLPLGITVTVTGNTVEVVNKRGSRANALHGLVRAQIANAVTGIKDGWTKTLELSGVGFRAAVEGQDLVLHLGFSHPVRITPPEGITIAVTSGKIVVSGFDRQLVGQVAANIRAVKKPEPYKGKGIRYVGEYIRKKAGKAKAIGGAPGK